MMRTKLRYEQKWRKNRAPAVVIEPLCLGNRQIPMDVIAEILSRLPIKSIGQFILVCKSWLAIITSRSFSVMHAKNKAFSTLYCKTWFDQSVYKGHMIEVYEDSYSVLTSFKPIVPDSGSKRIRVVGSSNGLLFLVENRLWFETYSILNPITNERTLIKTLPDRDPDECGDYSIGRVFYGVGYSPSTNEYKILKGFKMIRNETEFRYDYEIFTVGVDRRFRKLSPQLFPDDEMMDCFVVPCNGALHWLVGGGSDNYGPSYKFIIAFDIAQENTRRILIPPINQTFLSLSVLNNSICLFAYFHRQCDRVNIIWKMEEYGGVSWDRLIMMPSRFFALSSRYVTPLTCTKQHGGDIILRDGPFGPIEMYCPKQGTCDLIQSPHDVRALFEFTPSFSSINEIMYATD